MKRFALLLAALLPLAGQSLPVDKDKAFGNPAAPVRIDIYSDFECPTCRAFHLEVLPMIERDYGVQGKIYIVSHEFPLNIPQHRFSREAANYATAAARVGKYDQVADALFQNQATWAASGRVWDTVAGVLTPAEQKKVQALAHDPSVPAEVQSDVESGNMLQVNSTPTVFMTHAGKRFMLPAAMNYTFFRSLVDTYVK